VRAATWRAASLALHLRTRSGGIAPLLPPLYAWQALAWRNQAACALMAARRE